MKLSKKTIAKTALLGAFFAYFALVSLYAQNPKFTLGAQPSPINIDVANHESNVEFKYEHPFIGTLRATVETLEAQDLLEEKGIQVDLGTREAMEGNKIIVDGQEYHLRQFHFHAPSEHKINGKRTLGEIHFVHKSDEGMFAVVGAFIKQGKHDNEAFKEILEKFPTALKKIDNLSDLSVEHRKKSKIELVNQLDVTNLLPLEGAHVYRYLGSKTSGDLAPNVKWILLTHPIKFSNEQITILQQIQSTGTKVHDCLRETSVKIERSRGGEAK